MTEFWYGVLASTVGWCLAQGLFLFVYLHWLNKSRRNHGTDNESG